MPDALLADGLAVLVAGAVAPADGSARTVLSVALPAGVADEDFAAFVWDGIAIIAMRAVPDAGGGQDLVTEVTAAACALVLALVPVPSDRVAQATPATAARASSTAPSRARRRIRTHRPIGRLRRASGSACRAWPPGANRAPAWRAATRRARARNRSPVRERRVRVVLALGLAPQSVPCPRPGLPRRRGPRSRPSPSPRPSRETPTARVRRLVARRRGGLRAGPGTDAAGRSATGHAADRRSARPAASRSLERTAADRSATGTSA